MRVGKKPACQHYRGADVGYRLIGRRGAVTPPPTGPQPKKDPSIMAIRNPTALETRLNETRYLVQIVTDLLERRFADRNELGEDDQIMFLTYQANEAAREAAEEFERQVAA